MSWTLDKVHSNVSFSVRHMMVSKVKGRFGEFDATIDIDEADDVGEAILDSSKGADLIVAGAYGHSRLREFVFGGVTRSLFQAVDGPSLLAAH